MSMLDGVADLLQFSNGFVEQSHFFECDAEIIVRVRILGLSGGLFRVLFELGEHVRESGSSFMMLDLGSCGWHLVSHRAETCGHGFRRDWRGSNGRCGCHRCSMGGRRRCCRGGLASEIECIAE